MLKKILCSFRNTFFALCLPEDDVQQLIIGKTTNASPLQHS